MKQYFSAYDKQRSALDLDFLYCPKCGKALQKKIINETERNCCPACGYIQYINPFPGVSVVIEKDGKVLIGKRTRLVSGNEKWCLPCGFIEYQETYLDAAHREVREETGLRIRIRSLINVTTNHIRPDLHSIVPVLLATVAGGKLKPGDDLIALDWLSAADPFPEMAFEADEYIIRSYFNHAINEIPIEPRFAL